jgi:hypothetical protein
VKITLKGVLKVLGAVLPFLPGGSKSPHAGVTIGRLTVATSLTPGAGVLEPVSGIAVNIDADFLSKIDGAQEIAAIVDPTNAVLFIASGANANLMRAALGLPAAPAVSH